MQDCLHGKATNTACLCGGSQGHTQDCTCQPSSTCYHGLQVEGDSELQQGAEVEFFWGQQPETGALKATSVKLRDQVQQEGKVELGQV